uniref:Uncharacterized protein n=1 Tax=Crocodylus porosus TaxID=8502 RepID=A0A7M4FTF7_CROPO
MCGGGEAGCLLQARALGYLTVRLACLPQRQTGAASWLGNASHFAGASKTDPRWRSGRTALVVDQSTGLLMFEVSFQTSPIRAFPATAFVLLGYSVLFPVTNQSSFPSAICSRVLFQLTPAIITLLLFVRQFRGR